MKKTILAAGLMASMALNAGAQVLGVQDYLAQVQQNNDNVKGALSASTGAIERAVESQLMFAPSLFATGYTMDDKRNSIMEDTTGDETKASGAEVGVTQVSRYGTAARVSYGVYRTDMYNANLAAIPQPKFTDTSLKVELSQPLWKNAGGRQFKHTVNASEAQAKAASYAKMYEAQMYLLDAEVKYWKLAGIRESITVLTTSLEKTKAILEFNQGKFRKGLTDINDVLQCEAQVKARNLDRLSILSEEKEAMLALNEARKFDAETVEESTPLPDTEAVLAMLSAPQTRSAMRNDVKAAEQGVAARNAALELTKEKTIPDLSVFTVASVNSRKDSTGDSLTSTFNGDHPYYEVGLTFSMPLDAHLVATVNHGHDTETKGAKQQYQQQKYKQDREWAALLTKLQDVKDRLIAADELEKAQLLKLEKERERQQQGQSTMFQVFVFEQEYLSSQLNLITLRGTALGLLAQAKTFNEYQGSTGGVQ